MRLEDSAGSCGRGSGGIRCSMVEHDSLLFITLTYEIPTKSGVIMSFSPHRVNASCI